MSWAGSEIVQLYLGTSRVAMSGHVASSPGEVQWLAADSPVHGLELALAHLDSRRWRWHRPRLAISLSGALAPPFLLEPVTGVAQIHDARQIATHMAQEATGLEGPCVVWLDAWSAGRPCLCVAMERAMRDAIESTSRHSGARLVGLRPWWMLAFNHAVDRGRAADALLLVDDTDAATILIGAAGALATAASYSPRPEPQELRALTVRALLTSNVESGSASRVAVRDCSDLAAETTPGSPPFGLPLEAIP